MPTKPLPPPTMPVATAEKAAAPRRILPDTPRTWPRGRWNEATFVLGDLGLSLAHFVTWLVVGLARLLFGVAHGLARGLGWLAGKLSRGSVQGRGREVAGWMLLVALVAGSYPAWGAIGTFAHDHLPNFRPHGVVAYVPPPSSCALPRARCANASEALDGQPSITAVKILAVLQSYNSPAATEDFAADLYDLGIKYGVNPAYALGFFAFESRCGTAGIATVTHSLGNVRFNPSSSPVGYSEYNGFRQYASWRDGAEDWYWVIRTYYLNAGTRDIYDVTPIYAPASDHNDPQHYADTVYGLVQQWAQG
jgi:hypothetical protein